MDNELREKLIKLIDEVLYKQIGQTYMERIETIADNLIANGATVQVEKPLEAFLHPVDAYDGLKAKYLVFKADTGAKVENCFVLCPDKDPAAVEALRAYANATDNETLAEDIDNWIGKGVTVHEWIPVSEPPEEYRDKYGELIPFLVCEEGTEYPFRALYDGKTWGDGLMSVYPTHWMPLPEPPETEA